MWHFALLLATVETGSPDDAPLNLLRAAQVAMDEAQHAKAVVMLRRLEDSAPSFEMLHEAQKLHGAALASLGRAEEALVRWEDAASIGRQRGIDGAFTHEVGEFVMRGAMGFHHLAARQPDNPSLHVGAGVLTRAVGKDDLALEHLEAALRLSPENAHAMLPLGLLHATAGRPEAARPLLESALALQPGPRRGLAHDYMTLAAVACQTKDTDACHTFYTRAYQTDLAAEQRPVAAAAITAACMALIQERGEAGMAAAAALGARGVLAGVLHAPLQLPQRLVHGLSARPWWDDSRAWPVVESLEAHAAAIREEVLHVHRSQPGGLAALAALTPDSASLVAAGSWHEVDLIRNGVPVARNLALMPVTARLLLSMREATSMVRGGCKVSFLSPGTVIAPHSGLTNSRLRIHLGLSVPRDCGIVVNGEARTWQEGRCLVLDDSFVHSVWHRGTAPRIILIVDVWHPEMDDAAREESLADAPELLRNYQAHRDVPPGALATKLAGGIGEIPKDEV